MNIKAYRNPAKENQITFSYANTEYHQNMELKCFDVFGKQVHSGRVYQFQGKSKVDIHDWKPGIYFATLKIDGNLIESCKFTLVN